MMRYPLFVKLATAAVVGLSVTQAPADELNPDRVKKKTRVAIINCKAESDGFWVFTAGDIDGRRLELSNQTPCSKVLSSLAANGFEIQTPVTSACSGFSPDQATTMTAIDLAESGGQTGTH